MELTAKIQIYVSEAQKALLLDSMRAYSDACNFVSHYVYTTKDLSSVQKHTYCDIRNKYHLPSQMACNVIHTVIGSYKTNKANGVTWKECKYKPQMELSWNRDYSLKDKFSIGTIKGRIKVDYAKKGMGKYLDKRYGAAKVLYKNGKFFLYISVKCDCEEYELSNIVCIDRGIRFLATTYDGQKTIFFSGKDVKKKRAHYKELRRQLQQVGTPSARRRLKAIGQRENRWMRDVNHCISKALTENPKGTLFVLEDLKGIRSVTEKVKVKDRYVTVSWAYYDLEQKLTYKAEMNGQRVIKVDPAYTSQTCPKCGHTEPANRDKRKHSFCCKCCGYRSNDDRIGAMNLYNRVASQQV